MTGPLHVSALPLGPLQANCFVVARGGAGLVIDPGDEAQAVVEECARRRIAPAAVLLTHGHFDHFGGVASLRHRYDVPVYIGEDDVAQMAGGGLGPGAGFAVDRLGEAVAPLRGEQVLDLSFEVIAIPTPGHSRGSYTYAIAGSHLFVGDLLFRDGVGRTDLPGGDAGELLASIGGLIRRFPAEATVHCGHGPQTSLGRELAVNLFLAPLRHEPGLAR